MELDRKSARNILAGTVANLTEKLADAQKVLQDFDEQPESNSFDDYKTACYAIKGKLMHQAENDCEGSYNCGNDSYEQEFIVNGVHYLGELSVEYNRHDKTYYYIDNTEFMVTEIK